MMLSSASKYSIVVLHYLTKCDFESYVSVSDIAAKTSTPAPYLAKLTKELVWQGILESKRGAGGGVRLTTKGQTLSLFEVCELMNDPIVKQECVLRSKPCNPDSPCAFHHEYSPMRAHLINFLMTSKVGQELVSELKT